MTTAADRATVSAAAGYQVPEGSELYRGYVITPGRGSGFVFEHRNYAGPGDSRVGGGATIDECRAAIDERIDEGFDADAPPVGYAVRIGGVA